jgi:hypothetical protein
LVLTPNTSSRIDIGAHNNDLPNLLRALNERVFNVESSEGLVPTPQPLPGVWRSLGSVATRIAKRVSTLPLERLTCGEFIAQCPANKRALYTRAAEQLNREGWGSRDARIKAFVKFEKLNFTKKPDPAPRVIQPRSPVYNIALGRYTRRVESELYKALSGEWGEDCGNVVMKGLSVEEVGKGLYEKFTSFNHPVAISIDAKRFDQHVSADALKFEHSIYKRLFNWDPELCTLLSAQLKNKGCAHVDGAKITYEVRGTRSSGDMNTSLGNCIIMCTLVREYCRSIGVEAKLANNGDDCVLFMEKADQHKTAGLFTWFLKYGFEMTIDNVTDVFEQVEFCQMQPVNVDGSWVMVRQPEVALAKDAVCLGGKTEREFRQWSYQVGLGGTALYGDVPVYNAVYSFYQRTGIESKMGDSLLVSDSGFHRLSKIPRVRNSVPSSAISDSTRLSFFRAFGIPPSRQLALERFYETYSYTGLRHIEVNMAPFLGRCVN